MDMDGNLELPGRQDYCQCFSALRIMMPVMFVMS